MSGVSITGRTSIINCGAVTVGSVTSLSLFGASDMNLGAVSGSSTATNRLNITTVSDRVVIISSLSLSNGVSLHTRGDVRISGSATIANGGSLLIGGGFVKMVTADVSLTVTGACSSEYATVNSAIWMSGYVRCPPSSSHRIASPNTHCLSRFS